MVWGPTLYGIACAVESGDKYHLACPGVTWPRDTDLLELVSESKMDIGNVEQSTSYDDK